MEMPLTKIVRHGAVAGACLLATTAFGDYSVYEEGDRKVDLELTVVGATFMNTDSWYGESENFLGGDTDDWSEFGAEPGIAFEMGLGGGTLFGAASGVYTTTSGDDASGLTLGTSDADDMTLEQGHLGWRTSDLFSGLDEDTVTVSIGRQDYSIGTGMLINDGGSDGGTRGGFYLGMRKAFQNSALVKLESTTLKAEAFRLKNNPRSGGVQGEAYGANLEYTFPINVTLGGTYMVVDPELTDTDDLDVYDVRASWELLEGLTLSGEYALEESDQIDADGWYAQVAYSFGDEAAWTPELSYRYAQFSGDDPDTADDELFREIAYGFTDYGSWYQGEIAGNYVLLNGNTTSHMLRAKVQPLEGVTVSLIYYNFALDQAGPFGEPEVTSDDFGQEYDLTVDWEATENVYVIGVFGVLQPGDAAEEWVTDGETYTGDEDWIYGMLYVSYSL
jgi:hypothetical protein